LKAAATIAARVAMERQTAAMMELRRRIGGLTDILEQVAVYLRSHGSVVFQAFLRVNAAISRQNKSESSA
jgi:hypothetical protein